MSRDQIALVSDVHGNLTALEAVLADLDDRGITRVFNLGDYVGKGPRGREVVELCRERCEVNILGNWDDVVGDPVPSGRRRRPGWWRDELDADQLPWLAGLPFCHDLVMSGRRIRLMHASAETVHRRVRYVRPRRSSSASSPTPPRRSRPSATTEVPDTVGYADTHDPFYETQLRGRTLFNTGSAGNAMGDATASYCVIEGHLDEPGPAPWALTFVRVPYDVDAELAVARELGVPDFPGYESELRLGVYRGARREFEAGAFTLDTYYHAT